MIILARFVREFRDSPTHGNDGGTVAHCSVNGAEQIAEAVRAGFDEKDRGFRSIGVGPFDVERDFESPVRVGFRKLGAAGDFAETTVGGARRQAELLVETASSDSALGSS